MMDGKLGNIDVFPTKRIYTQGLAKIRTYQKEGFEHRVINKN